jgi:hypothetical protein
MRVKDLIEQLQKMDPNSKVLSPIDDEGNGYRWPECVATVYLLPDEFDSYRPESIFDDDEDTLECLKEDYDMELVDLIPVVFVG